MSSDCSPIALVGRQICRVSPSIPVNADGGFGITRQPHEGGDGAERGAKLGATARKPWGKGSSGSIGRSKVQLDLTETRGRAYLLSVERRCR